MNDYVGNYFKDMNLFYKNAIEYDNSFLKWTHIFENIPWYINNPHEYSLTYLYKTIISGEH